MSNYDDGMKELDRLLEEAKAALKARVSLDVDILPEAELPKAKAPQEAQTPSAEKTAAEKASEVSVEPTSDSALALGSPSALLAIAQEMPPAEMPSAELSPAEPLPAELPPAELPSAELSPAEPLPAELTPVEPLSAELSPVEPLSAELTPAEPLSAELSPVEFLPVELSPEEFEELSPVEPPIELSPEEFEELSPVEPPLEELSPEEFEELPLAEVKLQEEPKCQAPSKEMPATVASVETFVSSWPARQHVSPASLALDSIDEDDTFRLRKRDDSISALAVELARLGQLTPIDVRMLPSGRFQVVAGFRRLEALRFLQRDKVIARIHMDLSDVDAWLLALASSIHATPASRASLLELKNALEKAGQLQPALRDMLDRALAPAPVQEASDEVDADELAMDIAMRMATINQDLSLVADVFLELEPAQRVMLLKQLRYAGDMVSYLERLE